MARSSRGPPRTGRGVTSNWSGGAGFGADRFAPAGQQGAAPLRSNWPAGARRSAPKPWADQAAPRFEPLDELASRAARGALRDGLPRERDCFGDASRRPPLERRTRARIDEPVPLPSAREQPGRRPRKPWRKRNGTLVLLPAVEARPRRIGIGPGREPGAVLARVQEDVGERVAHLARRLEPSRVVAVGEDLSRVAPELVQGAGEARGEPVHGARERVLARRLDDQVQVVRLHAVLDHAEGFVLRARLERACEDLVRLVAAQARQIFAQLERHERRMPRAEARALRVRHSGALALRLASRATPLAAPVDEAEFPLACLGPHADQDSRRAQWFARIR